MGTDPLQKNRDRKGLTSSKALKSRIFYCFFPQAMSAHICIPLMSQYAAPLIIAKKRGLHAKSHNNKQLSQGIAQL